MGMSPNSGMQNYSPNMYNGPSQPQQMSGSSNVYGGSMQMNRNMNNSKHYKNPTKCVFLVQSRPHHHHHHHHHLKTINLFLP
jgi:hypothetical protein